MFAYKRIVVAQHERGLLFRDRQLVGVLEPGVYPHFDPLGRVKVELHDLGRGLFDTANAEVLVKTAGELLVDHLEPVFMAEHEIGLVYRDEKFAEAVAPVVRSSSSVLKNIYNHPCVVMLSFGAELYDRAERSG